MTSSRGSKISLVFRLTLLLASALTGIAAVCAQDPVKWHYPLYLANMDYWRHRVAVDISNPSELDYKGEPVWINTGNGSGEAAIEGCEARSIRITDQDGTGLLCRIISPDNKLITEGKIQAGSKIIIPVTVAARSEATLFIYWDNPSAWPVGAVLEAPPSTRRRRENPALIPKENPFRVNIDKPETLLLNEKRQQDDWPGNGSLSIRIPVKVFNFSPSDTCRLPVYIRMDQLYRRLQFMGYDTRSASFENPGVTNQLSYSNAMLLDTKTGPETVKTLFAYFTERQTGKVSRPVSHQWHNDKRNLVKGVITDPSGLQAGKGWSCPVQVSPGRTYMAGASIKGKGLKDDIRLELVIPGGPGREDKRIAATNKADTAAEWTEVSCLFRVPLGTTVVSVALAQANSERVLINDLVVLESVEGFASSMNLEQREEDSLKELKMWPVLSVRKVFREDLPPADAGFAAVSAAGNETEPLQVAVRSPGDYENVTIEVSPPSNGKGISLDSIRIFREGYVPIDYPSDYYERKVPYWYLKYPDETPGSDGWAGYWPDPLLPAGSFTLRAGETQSFWIETYVPAGTPAGKYSGELRLKAQGEVIASLPWNLDVHSFTLPAVTGFAALYDYRSPGGMPQPGPDQFRKDISPDSLRSMYLDYMAAHRICTGEIEPVPEVKFINGHAAIDFTEYDKAATQYFDVLKNPVAYLPVNIFYLFGWAFPPSEKFGEKPYPGIFPYEDADRAELRPEYRKAYQAVLKIFWDHLREKGWAGHYVLYLSDEPHSDEKGKADIVAQMKALCNMIHEVDPSIPVYVSTWWYRPEWKGYIDIWGLGFNGDGDYGHGVTEEDLATIRKSGAKIWYTTDGNFCTDTPFTGLERLLPWFGFRYGAAAYEFWGVNWLTLNPFKYGWHNYIFESQAPGEESWKRYPNGDGYIIYPGKPAGYDGLIGSVRIKQVREGAEDYEYLSILKDLVASAPAEAPALVEARQVLEEAYGLVRIPCSMGRYSTSLLKDPAKLFEIRNRAAECIEKLKR